MSKDAPGQAPAPTQRVSQSPDAHRHPRIHPVIIYPFSEPNDFWDLEPLYEKVAQMAQENGRYARPITIMDRKTVLAMKDQREFLDFRRDTVERHSDVLEAWCVDTCQMWYAGLGAAFDRGQEGDVYWLIPGDFNYGTAAGREVLNQLERLPEAVRAGTADFCIGEITMQFESAKEAIDSAGTFPLLYSWFPLEARRIRQLTKRPRSEFFAIGHGFLLEALRQRWYAYEQTTILLLQAVADNRPVGRVPVGDVSDLALGRESLASGIIQLERIERALKSFWLERNHSVTGLAENYLLLQSQSDQICHAAQIHLQNILR